VSHAGTPETYADVIGYSEEITATIENKDFQRWAAAVGDLNRLYFDQDFARANGHPDVVMPPMYLSYAVAGFPLLHELRRDGTRRDRVAYGPLPERVKLPERLMAGGEERWFYAAVHAGDVISSRRTISNIEQKTGRSGPFFLVTWLGEDRNLQGVLVCKSISAMIAR